MEQLIVGPLAYEINERSWLSVQSAKYALERLWAIVGNNTSYEGVPLVSFAACEKRDPHDLIDLHPGNLTSLPPSKLLPEGARPQLREELPILFPVDFRDGKSTVESKENSGGVFFTIDLVAATFFMLSRWEETVVPARDSHGRFPAHASVAHKQRFLDRPIIDEFALIVREWIKYLNPNWNAPSPQFRIHITHDIDHPLCYTYPSNLLRTLGHNSLSTRQPLAGIRELLKNLRATWDWHRDPYYLAIHRLMDLSDQHGLNSTFFVMTERSGRFDPYHNDPRKEPYRRIIKEIVDRNHEIGIHPSYGTFLNPSKLAQEKARLDSILSVPSRKSRQHYLRFRVPETWRFLEESGVAEDSTLTFAEHVGFRCGTCHPFPTYDVKTNRQMKLVEEPLIVMDGSLKHYMRLTPEQGKDITIKLAQRCQAVGGTFNLLWHNSSLYGGWDEWAKIYEDILEHLAPTVS